MCHVSLTALHVVHKHTHSGACGKQKHIMQYRWPKWKTVTKECRKAQKWTKMMKDSSWNEFETHPIHFNTLPIRYEVWKSLCLWPSSRRASDNYLAHQFSHLELMEDFLIFEIPPQCYMYQNAQQHNPLIYETIKRVKDIYWSFVSVFSVFLCLYFLCRMLRLLVSIFLEMHAY